mmetsp:Transcript_33334/g.88512  ORF Transcript_33334/g.88512 Transcript_33334/m.88512 type:complete len:82 (-) Transcript_33334:181-426(-)
MMACLRASCLPYSIIMIACLFRLSVSRDVVFSGMPLEGHSGQCDVLNTPCALPVNANFTFTLAIIECLSFRNQRFNKQSAT